MSLGVEKIIEIAKSEIEKAIRDDEFSLRDEFNYILDNGTIVNETISRDVYALLHNTIATTLEDVFMFYAKYHVALQEIVHLYFLKSAYKIVEYEESKSTPKLKYYVTYAMLEKHHPVETIPLKLYVNVYDFDQIVNAFGIPDVVRQLLGGRKEVAIPDIVKVYTVVKYTKPFIDGYPYQGVYDILKAYFVNKSREYAELAFRIEREYYKVFPKPFAKCFDWKSEAFVESSCEEFLFE